MSGAAARAIPGDKVVHLGKYQHAIEKQCGGDPFQVPKSFKHRDKKFYVGEGYPPENENTVVGKIYQYVKDHPGLLGEDLLRRLLAEDWSKHNTDYARTGKVCALWMAGYLAGMTRETNAWLRVE